jgi:hypothetical protein
MSSTNFTPNYNLPQFIGSDKPAWLTDWNSAMLAIDTALATIATAESGTATSLATLSSQVETLATNQQSMATSITTLTTSVNSNTGAINTINSLIGNGEPTTQDKTIIGAINELAAEIPGPTTNLPAANVSYDNTTSGLTATNAQAAIDEIVAALPTAGAVELQTGTLASGSTSVTLTFAEQAISATSLIDVYVEDGINYTAIATTSTTVTLTFEAQDASKAVAVRVTN